MSAPSLDSLQNLDPNGQFSAHLHFYFSGFFSNNQSHIMNSSNANNGRPGFGSSSDMNSGLGFNSPGLGSGKPAFGSASGLSKPRLAKLRKHPKPTETRNVDPGFNPFRPVSDNSVPASSGSEMGSSVPGNFSFGKVDDGAFVFGSSLSDSSLNSNSNSGIESSGVNVGNMIAEDMRKLKIDSEKDFMGTKNAVNNVNVSDRESLRGTNEIGASKLTDEMGKLKMEGTKNVEITKNAKVVNDQNNLRFGSDKNIASGKNVVAELLPNELKNLNIEDPGEVDGGRVVNNADDMEKFPFASSGMTLHNKMNSLNIKDSINTSVGENKGAHFGSSEKGSFVFGSGTTISGNLGGRTENMIIDEIGKLNIGSGTDQKPGQAKMGFSSSGFSVNKMHQKNVDNKKFNNVSNTIPTEFAFDHPQVDTKLHGTFEPVENVSTVPSMEGPKKKDGFSFTSKRDDIGTPPIEFKTPNLRGNLYSGINQKLEFGAKWEFGKDTRSKKKRGKLRKPTSNPLWAGQNYVTQESNSQENVESYEAYSPMDVSPYQEILADDKNSRDTSVTSDGSVNLDDNFTSDDTLPTVSHDPTDEDLVNATQCLDINEGDKKYPESKGEDSESFKSAAEQLDNISDMSVNSAETGDSVSSKIERQVSDGRTQFNFASSLEDTEAANFTFAAFSSSQSQFSSSARYQKKKNWTKVGQDSYNATPNAKVQFAASSVQPFPLSGNSSVMYPRLGQKEDPSGLSISLSKVGNMSEAVKKQEILRETTSVPAASISAQEACEKWRLRGNQAYANGDLSKAEDYYTLGVNCISQSETSRSCLRALMLCYSNRAATRMSLGRMREALGDCMMAASIDPNFVRVQVRAANCYLTLGEVENAVLHFKKCLQSGSDVCVDRKLLVEASEGIQKAQKVSECISQSVNLLQRRKSSDLESALEIIAEALIISSNSEKLQEMKAEALFALRKYDEVIQMCERALLFAEMNTPSDVQSHLAHLDGSELWPGRLIIKSYFYLGRLDEALDFIKKQEEASSFVEKNGSKSLETAIPLAGTVRELLRLKAAGNEAFQSGRHAEAVEHYTAALSCNVESHPFAAICFCNRAAAYRALGQITDAIADCSLAIALDVNYFKAISRRATLYEMIRDYGQAAIDLQRLVTLLVKQVEEKGNHSGSSDRMGWVNELKQAQLRLSVVEEEDKKEIPLNMYLILGIEPSVSASEIKKAYRKAALKYHPDKAGQSLARSENGDDGFWKEVGEEVHKDADRLFKMIGEAYAVLSDPTKRSRYDLDEETRNAQKRGSGSSTSRTHTDVRNYPFERSGSRRQWQEWRSYGNSQSRGSEKTRSNRYS